MYSSYGPLKSSICPPSKCQIRVATSSITSWSCVTSSTVPSYFCSAMFSALMDSKSKWFVGSSSTSTFGFCSINLQKISRACSPPESACVGFSASSPLNSICPSSPLTSACVACGLNWYSHSRSEEHTSELQSPCNLVCRLLLEKTI